MIRFEFMTVWLSRFWYHIKEPNQSKILLKLLGKFSKYDLYYFLTNYFMKIIKIAWKVNWYIINLLKIKIKCVQGSKLTRPGHSTCIPNITMALTLNSPCMHILPLMSMHFSLLNLWLYVWWHMQFFMHLNFSFVFFFPEVSNRVRNVFLFRKKILSFF